MPIIHVNHTNSLAEAFRAKVNNQTISQKTREKIREISTLLYAVDNKGQLVAIAHSQALGKAAFGLDMKDCADVLSTMADGPAKSSLESLLVEIERKTSSRFEDMTRDMAKHAAAIENKTVTPKLYSQMRYLLGPHDIWPPHLREVIVVNESTPALLALDTNRDLALSNPT